MSEPIKNIVLVGRTGNGKSATGNSLLGKTLFKSGKLAVGVTMKCEMRRAATQDGPIINVIDTPGLFDLSVSEDYISKEIINCLTMAEEGIHAVLLVLSARGRVSQEEESTLNNLQCIFDSKILDYFIVVFTGGDEFDADDQTLDDYFSAGYPEFLTNVLRLCGGRKVLFNNTTTDKNKKAGQLKQLLDLVGDVEKQTGGIPYTYQMHHKIKEENDEKLREQERMIEAKNLAEAELAVIQEKLRMEEEKNKQLIAHLEANEKLMEQERAKNHAEAELVLMQEKLRMEKEKLIAQSEANEKLMEQERAMNRVEAELAVTQQKLRMEQEKLQTEQEKNKQLITQADENEDKLREQERVIESKNRTEAELVVMKEKLGTEMEKLRVEEEKNKQLTAQADENEDKLREQERVIESKNRAEAELVVMKEKLRMEEEKNKQLTAHAEEEKRLKEQQMIERKKVRMINARDLYIEWIDTPKYWKWINLDYDPISNTAVEGAELVGVWYFDVGGLINTKELAPWTHYEIVYLVQLKDSASGWGTPVKLRVAYGYSWHTPIGLQQRFVDMREHIGKGWVTITAGGFITTPEDCGQVMYSMYEIDSGNYREGIIVKGVIIRPIN